MSIVRTRQKINLSSSVLLPVLNRLPIKKSSSRTKSLRESPRPIVKQLEERILGQKQEINRNEAAVNMLTMQLAQLKQQMGHEQERVRVMQAQHKQLEERHVHLQNDYSQLRKAYSELLEKKAINPVLTQSSVRRLMEKEREDFVERIQSLQESVGKLALEVERREQSLGEAAEERERVADLVEAYLAEMNGLRNQIEQLTKQTEALQAKNKQLVREIEAMSRLGIEPASQRAARSARELEATKSQLAHLQEEMSLALTSHRDQLQEKNRQIRHIRKNELKPLQKKCDILAESTQQLSETIKQHLRLLATKKEGMEKLLSCRFCNREICEAVSVVPCGHSYCKSCKKGYESSCFRCGPKRKIEGLYRNGILDEVKELFTLLCHFGSQLAANLTPKSDNH